MKKLALVLALASLSLSGCSLLNHHNTTTPVAQTYVGQLPCADCSGIKTKLTLNPDLTYVMDQTYVGSREAQNTFQDKGTYTRKNDEVTLDSGMKIKVETKQIRLLNADGKVVTGPLAQYYVLELVR